MGGLARAARDAAEFSEEIGGGGTERGGAPRAGGEAAARMGGLGNETETSCRLLCCRSICLAERPEQERTAGRRPGPVRAIGLRHPGKLCQRFGLGMTEGKPGTQSGHSAPE